MGTNLLGGHRHEHHARRLATVKAAVRESLLVVSVPEADVTAFLDEMPDRYFFTVPEEDIPLHFELMRSLDDRALVCRSRTPPSLSCNPPSRPPHRPNRLRPGLSLAPAVTPLPFCGPKTSARSRCRPA